jgi:hypothetical protein
MAVIPDQVGDGRPATTYRCKNPAALLFWHSYGQNAGMKTA